MQRTVLFLLIFLTVISLTTKAYAQLSAGLRGGVNFANLKAKSGAALFDVRAAPNVALVLNYALSPAISFQIEPSFAQRGAQILNSGNGIVNNQSFSFKYKSRIFLHYIEVPVLFQYKPQLGKLQGILSLGPELRLLAKPMKTKVRVTNFVNGQVRDDLNEVDTYPRSIGARTFDLGLSAGAGISYPLGALKFFTEARYHLGLIDIYGHRESNGFVVHNRGVSVHLGVLMPIGKK
jgi:hypothetical protein